MICAVTVRSMLRAAAAIGSTLCSAFPAELGILVHALPATPATPQSHGAGFPFAVHGERKT